VYRVLRIGWVWLVCATLVPASFAQQARGAGIERPNIVVIVVDDLGVDKIGAYGEAPPGVSAPCTPNIDGLAREGVLFRNVWTNPFCSPSRAQILTGRHGFRTGVGAVIPAQSAVGGLSAVREHMIPRVLLGYATAAVGKWHLSDSSAGGLQHPVTAGFGSFAGSLYNLTSAAVPEGGVGTPLDCSQGGRLDYYHWVKTWDPDRSGLLRQTCSTRYATTETADDAILAVQRMQAPWFLYVSFNSAHRPFQPPPARLRRTVGCPTNYSWSTTNDTPDIADAMIEVMDAELGRMLDAIRSADPEAYIILVSDNGTDELASQGEVGTCVDPERAKGTLYEGGIRVPLIIAGPGVVAGEVDALVNSTDIFATVGELASAQASAEDSVSLVPYLRGDPTPRRQFIYAERFFPNLDTPDDPFTLPFAPLYHLRTARSERFKLFRFTDHTGSEFEELFDLEADPCELVGLNGGFGALDPDSLSPVARSEYVALRAEMIRLGVY